MGSSSKKKQGSGTMAQAAPAPPPPPTMGTSVMPDGANMQYFANPTEVPQSGGLVLPRAGPGMLQGVGLNMYTPPPPPPPPPPRQQLAQTISQRPQYEGRGARGMSGAYGNSSRSGRSNDR